jgi:prepilin-type N-terminal cleavage/methylation domain-containing protein
MTKSRKRGGFTLIEIIITIVVVAVIMGIVIPKIMSNSSRAEISQVISSDVTSIATAASEWRRVRGRNIYGGINAGQLQGFLPASLKVGRLGGLALTGINDADTVVFSSGLAQGCVYRVGAKGTGADSGLLDISMDCNYGAGAAYYVGGTTQGTHDIVPVNAQTTFTWDDTMVNFAVSAFVNAVTSLHNDSSGVVLNVPTAATAMNTGAITPRTATTPAVAASVASIPSVGESAAPGENAQVIVQGLAQ